jgi:glycosyltransferase involved in cell wall biosynthesis
MSEANLTVSVVLPTMNRGEDMRAFLESLRAQSVLPDELVVVDAGDPVEAILVRGLEGSGIELVYTRSEPGTSLQRNVGIDLARGAYLFFLDDDMVLEPDYIERSLEAFELPMDPPVGGVMGSQLNIPADSPLKRAVYHFLGVTHNAPGDDCQLYVHGGVRWLADPSRVVPIPAAATGRVAYRAECLEQEKFSEFLPGYTFAEDVELAVRIARRWTIVHQPAARLDHRHSAAGRVGYGDRISRVMYSRFYFFTQHREKSLRNLAAFAWCHTGETVQLAAVGLVKRRTGLGPVLGGVANGYKLCLKDLVGGEGGAE